MIFFKRSDALPVVFGERGLHAAKLPGAKTKQGVGTGGPIAVGAFDVARFNFGNGLLGRGLVGWRGVSEVFKKRNKVIF